MEKLSADAIFSALTLLFTKWRQPRKIICDAASYFKRLKEENMMPEVEFCMAPGSHQFLNVIENSLRVAKRIAGKLCQQNLTVLQLNHRLSLLCSMLNLRPLKHKSNPVQEVTICPRSLFLPILRSADIKAAWMQLGCMLNETISWDNSSRVANANQLLLQQLVLEQLRKSESWKYKELVGPCESSKIVSYKEKIEPKKGDIVFVHQSLMKLGVIVSYESPMCTVKMFMYKKIESVKIHVKILSLLYRDKSA